MKYIGARYMPKFMGTYSATAIYEALSVVDDGLGTSYVSNKPVPAGTPLNDTNYWSVYGASSGAILDLQNRMQTAEEDIDNLENLTSGALHNIKNKKILILGDSISDETNMVLAPNWVTFFRTRALNMGATQVDNISVSGRSLSDVRPTNNLIDILSTITTQYDYIICFLGINDWWDGATPTQFKTALNDFGSWCNSNQPTAQVTYVTPVHAWYNLYIIPHGIPIDYYRTMIINACMKYNWQIIDVFGGSPNLNFDVAALRTLYNVNSDGVHPNATYMPVLGDFIFNNFISGVSTEVAKYRTQFAAASPEINSSPMFIWFETGGLIQIKLEATNFTATGDLAQFTGSLPSHFSAGSEVIHGYSTKGAASNAYIWLSGTTPWFVFPSGAGTYETLSMNGYYKTDTVTI